MDHKGTAAVERPHAQGVDELVVLASDWYWELDEHLRFSRVVAPSGTDVPPHAKIGRRRSEIPGALPLSSTWEEHEATLAARVPFRDFEYAIFPGHGAAPRYISVSGLPRHDEAGCFAGYRGTSRDITSRYVAGHAHFRDTLDCLTDGFATLDREWCITYVNPAALAVFGFHIDQVMGANFWDIFPDARDTIFGESYRRAMHDREPVRFEAKYPSLEMWFRVSVFPSRDGIAISFSDATEAHVARDALVQLNAELEARVRERTGELERAVKELEAFNYALAHDLRAPLSAIRGFGDALAGSSEQQLGARSTHFLTRIRAAARQMDEMADAILALGRVSREPLRRELVDLARVAADCADELRMREPSRRVRTNIHPCLWAEGDASLLRTVLHHLLGNAWKFTRDTAQAAIEMGSTLSPANELCFYVRDNGVGFEAMERERIFEPFYRAHSRRDPSFGTGIGLATARRIVERHGGRIWAEGGAGEGATVFFTLGAARGDSPGAR